MRSEEPVLATVAEEVLTRPIIVLGAPRSGTSVLAETLAAHPQVTYVGEPRLVWRYGNDRKSDMLREDDARPEVVSHIRSFFAREVLEHGGGRLLEKTPHNSLRPAFVDRVFPDCLLLHVIRDGPRCVSAIRRAWLGAPRSLRAPRQRAWLRHRLREAGWRRAPLYGVEFLRRMAPLPETAVRPERRPWGPRLPGLDGLLRDLDLLDVCCLMWRLCVETTAYYGRSLPSGRYMECHLEGLDHRRLGDILDFCQLDDPAKVTQEFERTFDRGKVVGRAEELTASEHERVMSWIGPTMAWLTEGRAGDRSGSLGDGREHDPTAIRSG